MSGKTKEHLLIYKVQTAGDPEAFAGLYDLYVNQIYRFVYFKVGSKEEAEDITSEVFLKAWHYLQKKKEVQSLSGLLYRMARNAIIDLYRKKSARPEQLMSDNQEYGDEGKWQTAIENNLEANTLLLSLKKLKQEYQEVLTLRYIEELNIGEIAAIVGKNSLAVRVTIHRAQKKLKELLSSKFQSLESKV